MATPLLKPAGANEYRKQKKINPTLTPPTPASRLRNVIHPFLMASFSYLRYFIFAITHTRSRFSTSRRSLRRSTAGSTAARFLIRVCPVWRCVESARLLDCVASHRNRTRHSLTHVCTFSIACLSASRIVYSLLFRLISFSSSRYLFMLFVPTFSRNFSSFFLRLFVFLQTTLSWLRFCVFFLFCANVFCLAFHSPRRLDAIS